MNTKKEPLWGLWVVIIYTILAVPDYDYGIIYHQALFIHSGPYISSTAKRSEVRAFLHSKRKHLDPPLQEPRTATWGGGGGVS